MDPQKVDSFIISAAKYFPEEQIITLRSMLEAADDSTWIRISTLQFKDPTITLIVSLLGGSLGIDRFYIGDMGLGIAKLLTCGGVGIWTIVDWFLIMKTVREKNFQKIVSILQGVSM